MNKKNLNAETNSTCSISAVSDEDLENVVGGVINISAFSLGALVAGTFAAALMSGIYYAHRLYEKGVKDGEDRIRALLGSLREK